ncbi:MAG: sugar phosphate isomerase/epimerase [Candidatus Latescibacterota bacterium]|nr:MAG: sugar phosphate isomerase/epimerase [Candidatus Latescibacterota bacterium]RKY72182.1 MAG: sugar phosphate isomerase/epimerase [Candidatus Latescibacterota bacterium]HDI00707.1 sugar phosphate isomerase/epimerase [Bacillota bacterium]
MMKLAFSTLGCPDWDLEEILRRAVEYGYRGVELRGYLDALYLPEAEPFREGSLRRTKEMFARSGVEVACVSSSAKLAVEERKEALREVRDYIRLAKELGSPLVRVFGGRLEEEGRRVGSAEALVENLRDAGREAEGSGIILVLETHDDFVESRKVAEVLSKVDHPNVGVLWDLHHPYRFLGEPPEVTLGNLGPFLRHVHVKDSEAEDGGWRYTLLGEGDVPVLEMLRLLRRAGYEGYLSLEWEKRWHPELVEPEVALPQYARKLREYLSLIEG